MLVDIDTGKLNLDPEGLSFKCSFCHEGGHRATFSDKTICCPSLKDSCDRMQGDYICPKHSGGCGARNHHHRDNCLANVGAAEARIAAMGHYKENDDGSPGKYQAPGWYFRHL